MTETTIVHLSIALAVLVLSIGGVALWLRQGRILELLRDARRQREYDQGQLEDLIHNQERILLREMGQERAARQREVEALQRRLLLQVSKLYQALERRFGEMRQSTTEDAGRLRLELVERLDRLQKEQARILAEERLAQQEGLARGLEGIGRQLLEGLGRNAEELGRRVEGLTESTDQRLQEISRQVEQRLSEGFDKTTETFTRVLEHLSRIDEAQKRITELSSNVVSLQEVLADKGSRGAFGEVQLHALVRDLMPENSFALQHTLSNGTRVDCILFLPDPTGSIAIDSKFPLESYQRMTDRELDAPERGRAATRFRQDIRRHIDAIASKYIIAGETADGAMMFIPAESVFAEIHAHHPELVEEAWRQRVWLVSPTTMMAVLTTARAVLKDAATREQVNLIQQHLGHLSKDFGRFRERMERLARHIRQAHRDVEEVNVSARKISSRFDRIERVELDELPASAEEPGEETGIRLEG
ncbi:MAG TPA: DNA recombination protein RmuC [Sedimenticola thiotaurini]|uniref:DNA recombination protein RmuC n=1 Tax=Sedimenticola thiotaurini TaxID=1543721 RepID=A0A831RJU8_9GAMM|nr:DNA recombination protein RmuC [Sedimenticola thiotaurini]